MSEDDFDASMAEVRKLRRKEFRAKVSEAHGSHRDMPDDFLLSTTYNGRQWHSLSLTPDEAIKVCAVLLSHLAKIGSKP